MDLRKTTFLYNPVVFRFYVNLPGCRGAHGSHLHLATGRRSLLLSALPRRGANDTRALPHEVVGSEAHGAQIAIVRIPFDTSDLEGGGSRLGVFGRRSGSDVDLPEPKEGRNGYPAT